MALGCFAGEPKQEESMEAQELYRGRLIIEAVYHGPARRSATSIRITF